MSVGIRILISFFRFFNYVNTIFSFIFQLEKQCFKNKTQVCVGKLHILQCWELFSRAGNWSLTVLNCQNSLIIFPAQANKPNPRQLLGMVQEPKHWPRTMPIDSWVGAILIGRWESRTVWMLILSFQFDSVPESSMVNLLVYRLYVHVLYL